MSLPGRVLNWSAHSISATDPWPIHARGVEEEGKSCNVCHFPEPYALPDLSTAEMAKPKPRPKEKEAAGLTCASCHLTPEGKIPQGDVMAKGMDLLKGLMK